MFLYAAKGSAGEIAIAAIEFVSKGEGRPYASASAVGAADKAVTLAEEHRPGLVLADIQLKDGDSGITTVQEILTSIDVQVIFVTGFPERLLTGERVSCRLMFCTWLVQSVCAHWKL